MAKWQVGRLARPGFRNKFTNHSSEQEARRTASTLAKQLRQPGSSMATILKEVQVISPEGKAEVVWPR